MLVLSYNIVHFLRLVLNMVLMGSRSLALFMNTLDLMFFSCRNWHVFRVVFIFVICWLRHCVLNITFDIYLHMFISVFVRI
jgi:hypothetical protein